MKTDLTGKNDSELHAAYHILGNEAAFAELMRRHGPPLMKFLRGMFGSDSPDADDVFQETWLRMINKGAMWNGGSFKAWITTVARNLVIDTIRRRKPAVSLDAENEDGAKLGDMLHDNQPTVPEQISSAETEQEINTAVNNLPEDQKEVFLMRTAEGLSFKEIAETLDISINTALGRMHYAVGKLKKTLAHLDDRRFAPKNR